MANEYMATIKKTKLPNHPEVWNTLRSGFNLVNLSEKVNYNTKEELMKLQKLEKRNN